MQNCQELDLVDAEVEDSQFTKKKLQEILRGWQKTIPKVDIHSKRRVLNVESLKIPTCAAAAKTENRLIVSDVGCHAILILHIYVKGCHLECSLDSRIEMTVVCKTYLPSCILFSDIFY